MTRIHVLHLYTYFITHAAYAFASVYILYQRASVYMYFRENLVYYAAYYAFAHISTDTQPYTYTWHSGIKGGLVAAGEGLAHVQRVRHLH